MATKSEDIRLSIGNVKHKKSDGTLYLMAERLAFIPSTKEEITISHKYSDIKMQKISPEGKAKIQLQVVLHTGENTTFQFANLEDRTAIKDALLQILPQFKGKMPKDRERKAVRLSENPHLLQLYKDLVEAKVISADEFWTQFADEDTDDVEIQPDCQDVGVSGNFLAGIPLNGKQVKETVSVETLMGILKTYPKVAKRHEELVPHKMSEVEFWNKFFQSRYFNRDRIKGDPFADIVKSDEKEWSSVWKKGALDPFLDIEQMNDNAYSGAPDDPPPGSSHENPDRLLIKRFNQQSIRLLESLQSKSKVSQEPSINSNSSTNDSAAAAATKNSQTNQDVEMSTTTNTNVDVKPQISTLPNQTLPSSGPSFREKRRDWTYDDLAGHDDNGDTVNELNRIGTKMSHIDRERYTIAAPSQNMITSQSAAKEHADALKAWCPRLTESIAATDATEALKNFAPGGYLMRSSIHRDLHDVVASDVQEKLKATYQASQEILRHFWMCFPAVEPSLEEKLVKIYETMKKFENSKLQSFHDSLPRDQRHLLNHILRKQFKAASRKYDSWKGKRRLRTK